MHSLEVELHLHPALFGSKTQALLQPQDRCLITPLITPLPPNYRKNRDGLEESEMA